jgi:ATP-dependent RNA helicase DeaD
MTFSDLHLHSAVASALAARGYDTPTPVQAAVLDPSHGERDLLVSSQTGSGKTVAFGGALANTLLGPDAPAREQRTAPIALVIVPTRELAIQVRDELGWLLRQTGLRLASFTGGTAVGGDLRALQKGLDIGIGTPGRLVDLLRRERLDLTHIRVAVLDEADEMLDLGFREDLQTLLQAAPAARRTLLLSATLPSEIRALARRFQRDALHIDPRKGTGAEARDRHEAHGDIKYVAHLIAASDRLAVVVNVLRAAGTGRAIVFCTTREAVSRMHAALVARGFAAAAISGERAQAERDRALGQLRSGDAQILVATNVAARGLHLPDVDWIVHADLPLNAESLTHRSGRTGRAGRKGTAVVIASLSERRKAERLLAAGNVPVVWTAPPSAAAITAAARDRLVEELAADRPVGPDAAAEDPAAEQMVQRLEATLTVRELARRLLARELGRLPAGEQVQSIAVPRAGSSRRDDFDRADFDDRAPDGWRAPGRSDRADFSRGGVLFRVNIGARDNADPRWLLPLFCRRGGVTRREVGAIRVGQNETTVEISGEAAADFALAASEPDPRAPHVKIDRVRATGAADSNGFGASQKRTAPGPRPTPHGAARKDKRSTNVVGASPEAAPLVATRTETAPGADRADRVDRVDRPSAVASRAGSTHRPSVAAPPLDRPSATAPRAEPRAAPPWGAPAHLTERATASSEIDQPITSPPASPAGQSASAGEHSANRPTGKSARPKAHVPIVEVKRGHHIGKAFVPGPPRRMDTPSGGAGASGAAASRATASESRTLRAPGHATDRGRINQPHDRLRETKSERPRNDGTNQARRSSTSPRAIPSHAGHSPTSTSGGRPPFWKEGARKRPAFPPARHERDAPKGRPQGR